MSYLMVSPHVSTNDEIVKFQLRELGEPICYFGEDPFERRERLSKLTERQLITSIEEFKKTSKVCEKEIFFSQGEESLLYFRKEVLLFSIPKSYFRLRNARERNKKIDLIQAENEKSQFLSFLVKNMKQKVCEMCDNRYLLGCNISPSEDKVLTFGASGNIKLWNVKDLTFEKSLICHKHNINDACWLETEEQQTVVSCDSAANIFLWNINNNEVRKNFLGHEDQVNKVVFHPLNKYLISASNDETWRVWNIETNTQILIQEGHSRPIFGLDIHPDGALVISGDSAGVFRVWDIRTGRSFFSHLAHTQKIMQTQFSPSSDATFLTSSEDNYVKIWDLRKMNYPLKDNLLGHSKLISKTKYEPRSARYIVSASQDGTVKFWSTFNLRDDMTQDKKLVLKRFSSNYSCIKSIDVYSHKVTGIDVFADGSKIVTVGLDRTIRLWSCEEDNASEDKCL